MGMDSRTKCPWFLRGMLICAILQVGLLGLTGHSSLVARHLPRNTSSVSAIIIRQHGSRTSLHPSPVPRRPSLSRPPWTLSRLAFRTGTSRTPKADSGSCPTWQRSRVLQVSSRAWSPRYGVNPKTEFNAKILTFPRTAAHDWA